MRIAIVDDDPAFAQFLHTLMTEAGHQVVVSNNGGQFLRVARNETFDLILLDWNLPGMSGIDIIHAMRGELGADVPIILLTLRSEANDIVAGLEAGADDYVPKPVDGRVLTARIEALMRRRGSARTAETHQLLGSYSFDLAQEQVSRDAHTVQLTSKEFQLALALFRNMSRPLSRAYLLETIWNRSPEVQTRTLDSHVARLRSKMNLRPQNGYRLSPIYSYGYRLETIEGGADMNDRAE